MPFFPDGKALPKRQQAASGLISKFRQRLFPPGPAADVAVVPSRRRRSLQASIAELLLVNRLKARSQRNQASEMLDRASHIVFVTCKHWFSGGNAKAPQRRTPL